MRAAALWISVASLAPTSAMAVVPTKVVVLTVGVRDPRSADALRDRIRGAVADRSDIELVDDGAAGRLFRVTAPKPFDAAVASARKALRKASKAMRSFELDKAQLGYARATDLLQPFVGLRASRELDEERLALGVSLAHAQRNNEQLEMLLLEYGIRYGNEAPPQTWPPDVTARLSALAPPATAQVGVRSTPPGADVFLDGARAGVTPADLSIRPGPHRIEVELGGTFPVDSWVHATTLEKQTVDVELAPDISLALELHPPLDPLPPALAARALSLASTLGASLAIIGARNGSRITLRTLGNTGESRHDADDTNDGARLAVIQLLEPPGTGETSRVPIWASVGAGVAAAAIGAGIGLRFSAVGAQDDLISREGALTQQEAFDRRDSVDARAKAGAVLIGVGSVAFAGFIGWMSYDLAAGGE